MKHKKLVLLSCLLINGHSMMPYNFLRNMGIITTATAAALVGYRQINLYKKEQAYRNLSQDAQVVNPELYDLFIQIKKDMGISEDVKLRIPTDNVAWFNIMDSAEGLYNNYSQTVYLNFTDVLPSYKIIHNIAHELEHHRQFFRYPGSNPFSYANWAGNEHGADTAAATYQRCYDCLQEVAKDSVAVYKPTHTPYGDFTTASGYFAAQDYKPYEDKARAQNDQCHAHKSKTHTDRHTPLKDFLPMPKK